MSASSRVRCPCCSMRSPSCSSAARGACSRWRPIAKAAGAWLDASRADMRMLRLIAAAAAEWSAAGREPSYLLSGTRLAQFEGWAAQSGLALTQDERAFLEASLAERDREEAAERARQQRE